VKDLLRFLSEAQSTLAQPAPEPADPALAHAYDGILHSLLRRAQEQLAHVEALQRYVQASPDPVLRLDGDLICRYANPAAESLVGAPAGGCLGQALEGLVTAAAPAGALREACRRALDGGSEEVCVVSLGVPAREWGCHVAPARDGGGQAGSLLLSFRLQPERAAAPTPERRQAREGALSQDVRDRLSELAWTNLALQAEISQRARAEEERTRAEEQHQHAEEQQQRAEEQRLQAEEALRVSEWERRADAARLRAVFDGAASGIALVDAEGTIVDLNAALAELLGQPAEELRGQVCRGLPLLGEVTAGGQPGLQDGPVRREVRFGGQEGAGRWARVTLSAVQTGAEDPPLTVIVVEDVTEQREARAALVQAQKLSVAGQLAAALTHEVKNPLQSVIGCLGLIDEQLERGSDARLYLQVARQELRRADRILNRLRDLRLVGARREQAPTQLMELLRRVLIVTERQRQRQRVDLQVEGEDNLPAVTVAADQIEQVFLNLVLNALEAMPEGGRLAIRMERTADPEGVAIAVCDTGVGIPPEVMPRIFEFLFSTKAGGTGLGLFVSREIIRAHQGTIEVASNPGEGTRFDLWLPLKPLNPA
jgi:PAS domain S-box-containing protein